MVGKLVSNPVINRVELIVFWPRNIDSGIFLGGMGQETTDSGKEADETNCSRSSVQKLRVVSGEQSWEHPRIAILLDRCLGASLSKFPRFHVLNDGTANDILRIKHCIKSITNKGPVDMFISQMTLTEILV